MSKTFAQAPKPKQPSADVIAAFESGGAGHDSQKLIPAKEVTPVTSNEEMLKPSNEGKHKPAKTEPLRRLNVELPESLHRRFKLACIQADKSMQTEVASFIEKRTKELER